jgi:8-oxo-dGTP pyrophosphatase MutT (NUDIX family)
MNNNTYFQYCQKLVVFNKDYSKVLLAKRKGEADYDGVYSFIGGKMETTDTDLRAGIKREVTEEIGTDVQIEVLLDFSFNEFYRKKSGDSMVLPHHIARYLGGEIKLSDEYSDFAWVNDDDIDKFEPKIDTVASIVQKSKKVIGYFEDKFTKL